MSAERDWKAETLRLTAFLTDDAPLAEGAKWWPLMTGTDPDEMTLRQKTLLVQGAFGTGRLFIATNSAPEPRVDIVWGINVQSAGDVIEDKLHVLGPIEETVERFSSIVRQWLNLRAPVRRLAYGATFVLPVDDRETGYRALNDLLPSVKLDPLGTSDFLYQINRPRDSRTSAAGLRVNRLSKWSVSVSRRVQMSVAVREGGTQLAAKAAGGESFFAVRLETDVNTPAERTDALEPELVPTMYDELQDLAVEMAIAGDVP